MFLKIHSGASYHLLKYQPCPNLKLGQRIPSLPYWNQPIKPLWLPVPQPGFSQKLRLDPWW